MMSQRIDLDFVVGVVIVSVSLCLSLSSSTREPSGAVPVLFLCLFILRMT